MFKKYMQLSFRIPVMDQTLLLEIDMRDKKYTNVNNCLLDIMIYFRYQPKMILMKTSQITV